MNSQLCFFGQKLYKLLPFAYKKVTERHFSYKKLQIIAPPQEGLIFAALCLTSPKFVFEVGRAVESSAGDTRFKS